MNPQLPGFDFSSLKILQRSALISPNGTPSISVVMAGAGSGYKCFQRDTLESIGSHHVATALKTFRKGNTNLLRTVVEGH